MAIRTIEYLKSKFQTGDKPLQQDFEDLIDTLFVVQNKLFIPMSISDSITLDAINRLAMQDNDGKIKVWQPLPSSPGTGGIWSFKFNTNTDKEGASSAVLIINKFIDNPVDGDTFTLNYTTADDQPLSSKTFVFKDESTADWEVQIDAMDIWQTMVNLNEVILDYLDANTLTSRIELSTTYNTSLNFACKQFSSVPNNLWSIVYKPTSDPIYDTNEFTGGSSGVPTTINFMGGVLYSEYWNTGTTTPEEESQAFADYINESGASAYVTATVEGDTTILTAINFSVPNYEISLGTEAPEDAITFTEVETYTPPSSANNGYDVKGVISSIDLANEMCNIQVAGKATVKLSASATQAVDIEEINTTISAGFPGFAFKLIATENGEVKLVKENFDMDDEDAFSHLIFKSNYIIGAPISNASPGDDVEVILNIGSIL